MSARNHWNLIATGGPAGVDAAELRRALGYLMDPGECHEVRALPSGRSRLVRGDDLDAAVAAVEELADGTGVYLTANPVRPDLGNRAATNKDVTRRRIFYIDIDPVRPKDSNATDAEHEAARLVADAVRGALDAIGWPSPIVVDSGSGWHLHYLIDLPNTDHSRAIVGRALKALAACHDTPGVIVDSKVANASRIVRLPGTLNRKGPNTADRPHRLCRIASVPSAIEPVAVDLLRAVAGIDGLPQADDEPEWSPPRDHWTQQRADDGDRAYALGALRAQVSELAGTSELRNDTLYESALKLGGYVASGLLNEAEVVRQLSVVARGIGLGSDGDPREIERAITNGLEAGKETPKRAPEKLAGKKAKAEHRLLPPPEPGTNLVVWAREITPKKVEFLWPGRIPLGKMTTFAGHGGLGKTFVICDIAARVTTGEEWPFSGGACAEPGKALIISGEDDEDDTLVPRLIECGADLSRVAFLRAEAHDHFTLAALDLLTRSLDQMRGVRLVAIDPPTSYLGGVDDHKNAELRSLLTPLKRWASEHRVAVILNNHVNKATGPNIDAASRVMGSVAWVNAVRAAHMFVRDPDDNDRVLFVPLKMNVARRPSGLAYAIRPTEADPDLARVVWLESVDQTADEAIGQKSRKSRGVVAVEWLAERFRIRREWPSDELKRDAAEAGISKNALWSNEVNALPIRKSKRVDATGEVHWFWIAQEGWPEPPICVGNVGNVGNVVAQPVVAKRDANIPGDAERSGIWEGSQGDQHSQYSRGRGGGERERLRRWLVLCLNGGDASPHQVVRWAAERGFGEAAVRAEIADCELFEEITGPDGGVAWHYQERW